MEGSVHIPKVNIRTNIKTHITMEYSSQKSNILTAVQLKEVYEPHREKEQIDSKLIRLGGDYVSILYINKVLWFK